MFATFSGTEHGLLNVIIKINRGVILKEIGESFKEKREEIGITLEEVSKDLGIKEVLLDQSIITGIGNIYADEVCSAIEIRPDTPVNKLNDEDIDRLIEAVRNILNEAIKAGGTTIRSYTSSLGVSGRFQLSLRVHTLDKCPKCGSDIIKIRIGGRGTYYCPLCQKER